MQESARMNVGANPTGLLHLVTVAPLGTLVLLTSVRVYKSSCKPSQDSSTAIETIRKQNKNNNTDFRISEDSAGKIIIIKIS